MTDTAERKKFTAIWRNYHGTLLFLLLMLGFRSAWADWITVPTGSMNPTILEGDRLLVDKHVFGLRIPFTLVRLTAGEDPARGDIVVFDSPSDGKSLVKRVIALPKRRRRRQPRCRFARSGPLLHASSRSPFSPTQLMAVTRGGYSLAAAQTALDANYPPEARRLLRASLAVTRIGVAHADL